MPPLLRRAEPAPHVIALGGALRQPGRLDEVDAPPRSLVQIRSALAGAPRGRAWLLSGGEPTTRRDLLDVVRVVSSAAAAAGGEVWLRTDGLALVSPSVIQALQRAGLAGVRIPLHSGRADAHDWLVGLPGAARRASRAISACASRGLSVEVEIALTRPTMPYLSETAALAARLGARALWIRRLRARGAAADDLIALAARLGQARVYVEEAVLLAEEQGMSARVDGLPRCVVPGAADNLALGAEPGEATERCVICPGPSGCDGAPLDYLDRFGRAELWRLTPPQSAGQIRLVVGTAEPTRSVRVRMARAARQRPARLRLVDIAAHPEAGSLLRDALRLSVPRVEVCGRIDALAGLSDTALFRLRGLARVDALAATPEAVAGLRAELSRLPDEVGTGVYGMVSSAAEGAAFRQAGADALRLAPAGGGSLAEMVAVDPAATPPCLGGSGADEAAEPPWEESTDDERGAVPTDRLGRFLSCPHEPACEAADRCPGLAEGWSSQGIAPVQQI